MRWKEGRQEAEGWQVINIYEDSAWEIIPQKRCSGDE